MVDVLKCIVVIFAGVSRQLVSMAIVLRYFWSRITMIPGCAKITFIVAYVECLSICHLT